MSRRSTIVDWLCELAGLLIVVVVIGMCALIPALLLRFAGLLP